MLYDYGESEQSRNGTENPGGYSLMLKQSNTTSTPTARPRLIQRLQGSDPGELHPLIFLEALLMGVFVYISTADVYHLGRNAAITVGIIVEILLTIILFIPFPGPLIGTAFLLLWGFLSYVLGSSLARGIGPVNSMIIRGVTALINFGVSLKARLSQG